MLLIIIVLFFKCTMSSFAISSHSSSLLIHLMLFWCFWLVLIRVSWVLRQEYWVWTQMQDTRAKQVQLMILNKVQQKLTGLHLQQKSKSKQADIIQITGNKVQQNTQWHHHKGWIQLRAIYRCTPYTHKQAGQLNTGETHQESSKQETKLDKNTNH